VISVNERHRLADAAHSHLFLSHPFILLRTFALPAKELSCLADIEAGMGGEGVVDDDVAALLG